MRNGQSPGRLSIAGKLPEGYVILCHSSGEEYSFLAKTLGISVECHIAAPHGTASNLRRSTSRKRNSNEIAPTAASDARIDATQSNLPSLERRPPLHSVQSGSALARSFCKKLFEVTPPKDELAVR
jgi:hypothetical protein